VVVIGGGFGGLAAAKALARAPVRVTLVDRHNYHLFQPLLYQVATATLSAGDIGAPIRWVLRKASNVRVLLGDAESVDVAARHVLLRDGARLDYDYLIVATGARHAYFGHPEWETFAPGLKTLDDALLMRRRILLAFERAEREEDAARRGALLTFVLVGGGPTGVELAGTLAEITRQTLPRDEFRPSIPRGPDHRGGSGPSILVFPGNCATPRADHRRLGVEVR
jgi:NADH dehydrogenase